MQCPDFLENLGAANIYAKIERTAERDIYNLLGFNSIRGRHEVL